MKPIPDLEAVRATDEFLVFEVSSFTDPEKYGPYRVDKTNWHFSGACSCERFCCEIQPLLAKNNWTGINDKGKYVGTTCKHIDRVNALLAWQVCSKAAEQRLGSKCYDPSEPNL